MPSPPPSMPRAARQSVTVPRLQHLIGGWLAGWHAARQCYAHYDKAGLCGGEPSRNLILLHRALSTTDDDFLLVSRLVNKQKDSLVKYRRVCFK
ncbi:hypothetical protein E2C01_094387 [Portunus trituberculatus]|uniref:Uncharacterized protein n=1 Tax=Portunus trituberculatus TaxID=210409 RepID=A0A5B7JWQ6_PORTR|nr:hypothetical protein [Portunus trituberculatus]